MRFWLRSPFLCNNNFFMKWIILHLAIYWLIGFIVSGSGMNGFSWALWLWYSSASQFTWFSSNQWLWAIMYINSNCIILLFELWFFFFPFWGMLGARGWGLGWQGRHGGVRNPWFPCLKRSYWLPFEVTIILVLWLRLIYECRHVILAPCALDIS